MYLPANLTYPNTQEISPARLGYNVYSSLGTTKYTNDISNWKVTLSTVESKKTRK